MSVGEVEVRRPRKTMHTAFEVRAGVTITLDFDMAAAVADPLLGTHCPHKAVFAPGQKPRSQTDGDAGI